MSIESLLRAAEAAGFAMASDENETPIRKPTATVTQRSKVPAPKDVLPFGNDRSASFSAVQEPLASWTRTQIASLLPIWYAKS